MTAGATLPLVAVRHAPTDWNRTRRLQGRTDVALDAAGIAVARRWRLDPAWAGYRVIASPMRRAAETARILCPDRTIEPDVRLVEMSFGDWEGKALSELRALGGGDAAERERMGLDFQAPGGESPREVQARLRPLLAEIAAAGMPTIIVTHKAVLRALLSLATGWDMLGKPPVKLQSDCAHMFALDSGGAISVVRMNIPLFVPALQKTVQS
ncbi:MAG TPA: histidine phosphatase family protein [Candidatus Cybelea sp.]|nr:histidine phosphatase family protein [Candidatus Cybelea sp.]